MEWGLFTSGYQYYPLERAFSDARRFGYDYIELWGGRPHAYAYDMVRGGLKEVRALAERYDMPVRVYTPEHNAYPYNYMVGNETQWCECMDYLQLCFDIGKELGADYTLISVGRGPYGVSMRELRMRLEKSLRALSGHAEKIGHKILLEPLSIYESNLCNTAGELSEVIEQIDSPCLLGMCDVVAAYVSREPVLDYLDLLDKKLAHLHIVDSDGQSDTQMVPGDGTMPLPELLQELQLRKYAGRATIELVSAYQNEPSLYARRALQRIKEMLQ